MRTKHVSGKNRLKLESLVVTSDYNKIKTRYIVDLKFTQTVCDKHWCRLLFLFPPPPRYNWNIVESGVKHHNPNPISPIYYTVRQYIQILDILSRAFYWFVCRCRNSTYYTYIGRPPIITLESCFFLQCFTLTFTK